MSEIVAFEAKTHLPQLLQRVEAGERFVITCHRRPVAELVPFQSRDSGKVRTVIEALITGKVGNDTVLAAVRDRCSASFGEKLRFGFDAAKAHIFEKTSGLRVA